MNIPCGIIYGAGLEKQRIQVDKKIFIDTHCHILPGVDDGPASVDASIDMAEMAADEGIGVIVATPHILEGRYDGSQTQARVDSLARELAAKGISVELKAGAEVPMSVCLQADTGRLKGLTLAGSRYLLMETAETTYDQLARAVHQVRLNGLYPILAHPERVGFVGEDPEKLAAMAGRGEAYCQITGASIEGLFGKRIQKTASVLLRRGLVHLVASDAHSTRTRAPRLSKSYQALCAIAGEDAAQQIMFENPGRVLSDTPLESIRIARKPGILSRILGRN